MLLPAIKKIKSDKHWRTRKALLEGIPNLAKNLSKEEFGAYFLETYISALEDPVCSIRTCCGSCLQQLCKIYGEEWSSLYIIPKVLSLWDRSEGYQQKITVMHVIQDVANDITNKKVFQDLLSRVVNGLQHPTPNIQVVAIQTIIKLLPLLDGR